MTEQESLARYLAIHTPYPLERLRLLAYLAVAEGVDREALAEFVSGIGPERAYHFLAVGRSLKQETLPDD